MPDPKKKELINEVRRTLTKSFDGKPADDSAERPRKLPERRESEFSLIKRVDPFHIEAFTRELSILLGSGLDLLSALRLLSGRGANTAFRKILVRVSALVEQGSAFWEALSRFPRYFPGIYVSSVKAGESSGKLESALEELSRYYEFEISARKKLKTIIFYPAAVLVLAFVVLIILSFTILPVFAEMMRELDAEIPVIMRAVNAFSGFIGSYWIAVAVLIVFLFVLPSFVRKTEGGNMLFDRIKLKIPLFGKIFLRIIISRFSRNLAILLSSGVRITEAVEICAETSGNRVVSEKLLRIRDGIERGESIEHILEGPGIFPPLMVDMLVVGEHSGELEKALQRIADVYSREAEDSISTFASVLEPALIISMGVLVAFVFSSLFLPYIEIISTMGSAY